MIVVIHFSCRLDLRWSAFRFYWQLGPSTISQNRRTSPRWRAIDLDRRWWKCKKSPDVHTAIITADAQNLHEACSARPVDEATSSRNRNWTHWCFSTFSLECGLIIYIILCPNWIFTTIISIFLYGSRAGCPNNAQTRHNRHVAVTISCNGLPCLLWPLFTHGNLPFQWYRILLLR